MQKLIQLIIVVMVAIFNSCKQDESRFTNPILAGHLY